MTDLVVERPSTSLNHSTFFGFRLRVFEPICKAVQHVDHGVFVHTTRSEIGGVDFGRFLPLEKEIVGCNTRT